MSLLVLFLLQGRTVDFSNVVVVMTSNLGSEHLMNLKASGAAAVSALEADRSKKRAIDPASTVAEGITFEVAEER